MQTCVDLVTSCRKWDSAIDFTLLATEALAQVMANFKEFEIFENVQVCLLLTNDRYMQQLNKNYRGKDKPTNVLSFAQFNIDYRKLELFPSTCKESKLFLGTIALGYQTVSKEAKAYRINIIKHITHLIVHGILHLLGFDHENQEDAEAMESLEEKILKNLKSYTL